MKNHNYLILGTPRSGTTRIHRILVNYYESLYDKVIPKFEFLNTNYYSSYGSSSERLKHVFNDTDGRFSVIKCLVNQLEDFDDDTLLHLYNLYDCIVVCKRDDIEDQALSYAIAHNLSMNGIIRWNYGAKQPAVEIPNNTIKLTEFDIKRFFERLKHADRIFNLVPNNKKIIIDYDEACQMDATALLAATGIPNVETHDFTVKLNDKLDKFEKISNINEVLTWISMYSEEHNANS